MDSKDQDPSPHRPDSPFPDTMINLRTPSVDYNHGGIYAPADPKTCTMPGGPCEYCQDRSDADAVAAALVKLKNDVPERCPSCNYKDSYVSHASRGLRTCNGCDDKFCIRCYFGSRYCCAYVYGELPPPTSPPVRQCATGVQSPKAEEKRENK